MNKTQTLCWVCPEADIYDISMFAFRDGGWQREKDYPKNPHCLYMLACSGDESFVIGTILRGFLLWNIDEIASTDGESGFYVLKLPSATRNVQTRMNKSTTCVLSAKNIYAIAGK